MEFSRIKNILIIILLILNLLLTVNIVTNYDFGRGMTTKEQENITAIFEKDGVALSPECLKSKNPRLPVLQVVFSESTAAAFLNSFGEDLQPVNLGKVQGVENTRFRAFQLDELTYRIEITEKDSEEVEKILKKAGITLDSDKKNINPPQINGYQVLNTKSSVQSTGSTLILETRKILETKEQPQSKKSLSPFSLLLSFSVENREKALGVKKITGYRFFYYITESAVGGTVLTPVMELSCDKGSFLMDGVSGRLIIV